MKIAIVILNWNGEKLLERFLPSVVNFSEEATIYVIDNASNDQSVNYLKTNFPTVSIIQNKSNGGYAKGYNEGLKQLKEDLFILLNSDVAVTKNWLLPILETFKNQPDIIAAQPKILDYKNKEYFEYAGAAGGYIDALGYPFCMGRIFNTLEKDENQYDTPSTIFWASGACLAIKKDAFWGVEGFDEDLFAHQEEIDLCWRLQSLGGVIKNIPKSKVYHFGGGTLSDSNPKKTFYNFRNSLLILLKNRKGSSVWLLILIRLVLDGIAGIKFLLKGKTNHFTAILKAHLSFYKFLPKYLKKRKRWASSYSYAYTTSIVLQYFIKKRDTFQKIKIT